LGFIKKEEKHLLDHLAEKRKIFWQQSFTLSATITISSKTRSQFVASSLETFVVSIESLKICLSLTLRMKTTKRKI
jgi:hypothetical protein